MNIIKKRWKIDSADGDYKLMTVTLIPPLVLGDISTKYQERCSRAKNLTPFKIVQEKNGQQAFLF